MMGPGSFLIQVSAIVNAFAADLPDCTQPMTLLLRLAVKPSGGNDYGKGNFWKSYGGFCRAIRTGQDS
jgi:hypothetical protein